MFGWSPVIRQPVTECGIIWLVSYQQTACHRVWHCLSGLLSTNGLSQSVVLFRVVCYQQTEPVTECGVVWGGSLSADRACHRVWRCLGWFAISRQSLSQSVALFGVVCYQQTQTVTECGVVQGVLLSADRSCLRAWCCLQWFAISRHSLSQSVALFRVICYQQTEPVTECGVVQGDLLSADTACHRVWRCLGWFAIRRQSLSQSVALFSAVRYQQTQPVSVTECGVVRGGSLSADRACHRVWRCLRWFAISRQSLSQSVSLIGWSPFSG